jgi:FtsP/CotA-like multicopper oxidase with cupredoxin domain
MKLVSAALMLGLLLTGCGDPWLRRHPDKETSKRDKSFGPVREDGVVRYALEAAETEVAYLPGIKTKVWAYNGTVPGPVLEANVGETLEVEFTNNLPVETTIHWHGVELPGNMDGSSISQAPIAPGETFVYRFKLLRAATYWYHPHLHDPQAIEKGLHGMLVVHDPDKDRELNLPAREINVVVDDVLLDSDGQVAEPPSDPVERAIYLANGREGNQFLVNGQILPTLDVKQGEPVRLRIVNASNARFFRLRFGKSDKLWQIGGDLGLLEKPILIDSDQARLPVPKLAADLRSWQTIVPGERAEYILVPSGDAGDIIPVTWYDFPRGLHSGQLTSAGKIDLFPLVSDGLRQPTAIAHLKIEAGERAKKDFEPPETLNSSVKIVPDEGKAPLEVLFGHLRPEANGDVMFFANGKMLHEPGEHEDMQMEHISFDQIDEISALKAKVGEVRVIEVRNMSTGYHPFHLHGFPFQVMSVRYENLDNPNLDFEVSYPYGNELKDTVGVPGQPGFMMRSWTTMRLAVHFSDEGREGAVAAGSKVPSEDKSGGWMVHCHIQEHHMMGMATYLSLSE